MENMNNLKKSINKKPTAKLVPDQWDYLELSQFAQLYKAKVDPSHSSSNYKCLELEHFDEGTGRINGFTEIRCQKSIKNKFEVGHVLFGKLRPYLRKFWLATFSGVCSSEVWVLSGISNKCDNAFLFYLVQDSRFIQSANVSTGTKMPRADWGYVSGFPFPLPPVSEQKKIALILSTWDRAIEKTEQLIAQKQQLKKGLMQQLLTGKMRFKEFVKSKKMKKTKLGMVPEDWEFKGLNEICSTFKSGYGITSKEIDEYGKYSVYGGNGSRGFTNSFTHDGDFFLIGRQGALCGNIVRIKGKNYVSEHAIAVQANQENSNDFLADRLEFFDLNRLSESSAQPGLSVDKLLKLKISVPPLPEQEKITFALSHVDKEISCCRNQLNKLSMQKKGLMQQLLTGKVRVKI